MAKRSKKWMVWVIPLVVIVIIGGFVIAQKSRKKPEERRTVEVKKANIVDKALAVGNIEPLNEIAVKSKISGVVGKLFVEVGDFVKQGDPVIEVKPDPTPLELVEAKRNVQRMRIDLDNLGRELKRNEDLKTKGLIADQDYENLRKDYDQAMLSHKTALERLALLENGRITTVGEEVESIVKAPITGFILEKNVNVGDPVVPLTSYQAGTELLKMADMTELIFKGTVDEIDVGRIAENLKAELTIGALPGARVTGIVSLISLKARKEDNSTVFPIEIIVNQDDSTKLRAGFSANAHIIIDQRDSVLTVPERVITFRNDSAFVTLPVGEEDSEEKYIKTGLSDAITIEIVEGLDEGQKVLEKKVVKVAENE